MAFEHYFICIACQQHIKTVTEESAPFQPGLTHNQAASNGALSTIRSSRSSKPIDATSCLGQIVYCSGFNVKANKKCVPAHKGTVELKTAPKPKPDPDWEKFTDKVSQAWESFVESGYNLAKRGVNNKKEYKLSQKVRSRLSNAGGTLNIAGGTYTVSESTTAGVSLHRAIPNKHTNGYIKSFIFHL